jgi:uncharacterized protein
MAVFLLLLCSLLAALFFQVLHLPAAWLFGPLVVSAFFAVRNWKAVTISQGPSCLIRAVIGTSLGAGFSQNSLHMLLSHLEIVAASVILIFCASLLNGWILARSTRLDTATAFLGTMPGGASAMMGMAESLQADVRLVAVMQYVRLLIILSTVFIAAPVLLHLFPHTSQTASTILGHTATNLTWQHLGILLLLTAAGYFTGMYTRIPAGPFLVPALLEFALGIWGISPGRWPVIIFAIAYFLMGLQVGGRFENETVKVMKGLFTPIVSTTFLLLIASLFLAMWLIGELELTPLSAYLAATPGGLDSIAAMAGAIGVDTSIILVIQTARLLSVLLFGPWLVRICIRYLGPKKAS